MGGEVGEHRGADDIPAAKRLAPLEHEDGDWLAADCEPDPHYPWGRCAGLLALLSHPNLVGVEEPSGLVCRPFEDLTRLVRAGHGCDRIDQRLEEARLRLELVLGDAVAAPLLHDESRRERARERQPDHEPDPCQRRVV